MLSVRYSELLSPTSRAEFEALVSAFNALWLEEHNEDGTHETALSITTWNPVIGGTTATSGQTYTLQRGYMAKYGRLFVGIFTVTLLTKGTISGYVSLQGVPFDMLDCHLGINYFENMNTNWITLGGYRVTNRMIEVTGLQAAGVTSAFPVGTDISNTTSWKGFLVGITP